jgi:hypothetical protein
MQTTQLHLRIEPDEADLLDKLAGKSLSRQAVAGMLLTAAIEAIQKNQGRLTFPPKFCVEDDSSFTATRFNEPQPIKRK